MQWNALMPEWNGKWNALFSLSSARLDGAEVLAYQDFEGTAALISTRFYIRNNNVKFDRSTNSYVCTYPLLINISRSAYLARLHGSLHGRS
eukprot:scaffold13640_cov65-Attheya_sp.AAC.1